MPTFATIIVGGGPGGLGPLLAAAQQGTLKGWLDAGVALIERTEHLGGSLGRFGIASDSLGSSYLECLEAVKLSPPLRPLRDHAVAREMETYRYGFPPLALVDRYMRLLGGGLSAMFDNHPVSRLYRGTNATRARLQAEGSVTVEVERDGETTMLTAHSAVIALGGRQHWQERELVPGFTLKDCSLRRVMPSDSLLQTSGLAAASEIIAHAGGRRILILGGSHSAYAAAWALTHLPAAAGLAEGQIEILQRRPPRIFYPDAEAAAADQYLTGPGDICPRTGRVHRMGGLRGFGREMWRQLAHRPGTVPDPRVTTRFLNQPAGQLRALLEQAALVVPCFGYNSSTLPVLDPSGAPVALSADTGSVAVGDDCRLLLGDGRALDSVFGIGLGTGYRLPAYMGGEPNFEGQANSLWLYQNDIGAMVHREVRRLSSERRPSAALRLPVASVRGYSPHHAYSSRQPHNCSEESQVRPASARQYRTGG